MNIVRGDSQFGVFSWSEGSVFCSQQDLSLDAEAAKGISQAEAVINRLLLQGKEEEAERILELYV